MALTLLFVKNKGFSDSLIDVLFWYDRIHRSNGSTSRYQWAIPGICFTPTARTVSGWFQLCLDTI